MSHASEDFNPPSSPLAEKGSGELHLRLAQWFHELNEDALSAEESEAEVDQEEFGRVPGGEVIGMTLEGPAAVHCEFDHTMRENDLSRCKKWCSPCKKWVKLGKSKISLYQYKMHTKSGQCKRYGNSPRNARKMREKCALAAMKSVAKWLFLPALQAHLKPPSPEMKDPRRRAMEIQPHPSLLPYSIKSVGILMLLLQCKDLPLQLAQLWHWTVMTLDLHHLTFTFSGLHAQSLTAPIGKRAVPQITRTRNTALHHLCSHRPVQGLTSSGRWKRHIQPTQFLCTLKHAGILASSWFQSRVMEAPYEYSWRHAVRWFCYMPTVAFHVSHYQLVRLLQTSRNMLYMQRRTCHGICWVTCRLSSEHGSLMMMWGCCGQRQVSHRIMNDHV